MDRCHGAGRRRRGAVAAPTGDGPADPLGIALAAVAGAAFAGHTLVLQRHRTLGDQVLPTMAAVFGGSALLLAPLLALGDHAWLGSPGGAAVALWLGFITAGLAYALYAAGLRTVPAPRALTMTLAEPATAVLLGVVLLGEPLTLTGLVGLLLVAGGFVAALARLPARGVRSRRFPCQVGLPTHREDSAIGPKSSGSAELAHARVPSPARRPTQCARGQPRRGPRAPRDKTIPTGPPAHS